jgi:ribonuclease-3
MALRHESFTNERDQAETSNERLEFLGDSVLGAVVCDYLYRHYPNEPEGRLAQMKSHLVSTENLAERGRDFGLGQVVLLGKGEEPRGRDRESLLADTFEALVGAIFLDAGFEAARAFLLRSSLGADLQAAGSTRKDHKTRLQEVSQAVLRVLPDYTVTREDGLPHDKIFDVEVRLVGELMGQGTGKSKQQAGQLAAQMALDRIDSDPLFLDSLRQSNGAGGKNLSEHSEASEAPPEIELATFMLDEDALDVGEA